MANHDSFPKHFRTLPQSHYICNLFIVYVLLSRQRTVNPSHTRIWRTFLTKTRLLQRNENKATKKSTSRSKVTKRLFSRFLNLSSWNLSTGFPIRRPLLIIHILPEPRNLNRNRAESFLSYYLIAFSFISLQSSFFCLGKNLGYT